MNQCLVHAVHRVYVHQKDIIHGRIHVYGELAMATRESRRVGTTQPAACGHCYVATELAQQVLCLSSWATEHCSMYCAA